MVDTNSQELWEMFDRVSAAIRTSHSQLSETIKTEVGEVKTQLENTKTELSTAIGDNQARLTALEKDVRDREFGCRSDLIERMQAMNTVVLQLQTKVQQHEESIQFYKKVAYGAVVFAATSLVALAVTILDHFL